VVWVYFLQIPADVGFLIYDNWVGSSSSGSNELMLYNLYYVKLDPKYEVFIFGGYLNITILCR
jgi:hypothetical protein